MGQRTHTFKVKEMSFRCTKLSAKTQFHIVRKLLPLFTDFMLQGESLSTSIANIDESTITKKVIQSLNEIKGEDYDYVMSQCLHSVEKEDAPGAYQNVLTSSGAFIYEDLQYDLSTMIGIIIEVLKFNFSDFFTGLPSDLPNPS